MRKKGYKGRTEKRILSKCNDVCRTYDAIQFAYADILQADESIVEIRCNVLLDGLPEGEQSYPVAESLMDNTLIAYLQYLSMTYDECGFNAGQASDAEGKRYELKDAEFLGEICEVDLLFDSTESNAMPVGLDIGRPASSYSAKEMYLKICKGLGVDATDDGDMLFLISIPDTDFEIKIFQVSSVVPSDILIRLADE